MGYRLGKGPAVDMAGPFFHSFIERPKIIW